MKPLRFRIWDSRGQSFWQSMTDLFASLPAGAQIQGNLMPYTLTLDGVPVKNDGTNCVPDGVEFIVEQFTGLKDKNGKGIYEGDILRIAEWNGTEVVFTQIGNVYWDPYACRFSIATDGGRGRISELNTSTGGLLSEQSRDEVVGNVHENPDLLS